MKKSIKKLQLNKLAIAKFSNSEQIKGGGLNCTDSYSCPVPKSDICISVFICPDPILG